MFFCILLTVLFILSVDCFSTTFIFQHKRLQTNKCLRMADVDVVFPNNKKTKVAVGSSLKDAAKKAGFYFLRIVWNNF